MLVRLYSAAVNGLDVKTVEVEVNISKGAKYSIVGLPDSAVPRELFSHAHGYSELRLTTIHGTYHS